MSSDNFDDLGQKIHQKMLNSEADASSELLSNFLTPIMNYLSNFVPNIPEEFRRNEDLIREAALDALFNYINNPIQYKSSRGKSLLNYLKMSAKGDFLNKIDKEIARRKKEKKYSLTVKDEIIQSIPHQLDRLEMEEQIAKIEYELKKVFSRIEWQLYELIYIDGKRKTVDFIEILKFEIPDIENLSEVEQRAVVKRYKDKIKIRIKRVCKRLGVTDHE